MPLRIKPFVKRVRKNFVARYARQCPGCNRHFNVNSMCIWDGFFGTLHLCNNCWQDAAEFNFENEIVFHNFYSEGE